MQDEGSQVALLRRAVSAPDAFWAAQHVFVVGGGHSGTSIVLTLLDNHSQINAIIGESELFLKSTSEQVPALRQWAEFWTERGGVLAEKTPRHVHHTSRMKVLFPNAWILGVCRDPLDTIASLKARMGELGPSVARYVWDTKALTSARDAGDIDSILRYEDLIEAPTSVLTDTLAEMGLSWEEGILETSAGARAWYVQAPGKTPPETYTPARHNEFRNWQINQPLFDGRGRHRGVLSQEEIISVWDKVGDLAGRLGYHPES